MESIWQKIEQTPRPAIEVDLPITDPATGGPVSRVLMRELTQAELQAANAEAERFTRGKLKDLTPEETEESLGYDCIFANALAISILTSAVLDPETRAPLFPSFSEAAKVLTQDTLGVLTRLYLICQKERGPDDGVMAAPEVDEWIVRLGGPNGSPEALALLENHELMALTMELAKRWHAAKGGS